MQKISSIMKVPLALSPYIKVASHSSVGVVTIDRPSALNTLNSDMFRTLYIVLRQLEETKSHVIIKGAGDKAFCAGGDINTKDLNRSTENFRNAFRIFHLVSTFRKPYISFMDGITMGYGSSLSIAGKYRIATERTIFAMPENLFGFFNDAGSSFFLSSLQNNIGMYLGLTGTRLSAYDMNKLGLATHFVKSNRLDELEEVLIACENEEEIGKAIAKFSSVPSSRESKLDVITPRIKKCFGGETVDEIYKNLQADGSDWALKTIATLDKMSPTSLKISHRCQTRGKLLGLEQCLKTEFQVALNAYLGCDAREGLRATLVDKDFNPQWNPKSLAEVKDEYVESFFMAPANNDELTFEPRFSPELPALEYFRIHRHLTV